MAAIAGSDDSLKVHNAVTLPDFRAGGRITAGRDVFTINAALWQTPVKSRFTLVEESQMSQVLARFKTASCRRAVLAGAFLAAAAMAMVGGAAPAAAFAFHGGGGFHGGGFHGGFGGFHGGFGGFHGGFGGFHGGFGGFHHGFAFNHRFGFGRRFAFGGPVFFPGYYYGDAGYDACLRRVWGPYGWRLINVCY
jgi:hypothetical protein